MAKKLERSSWPENQTLGSRARCSAKSLVAPVVYTESPSYQSTEDPRTFPTLHLGRGSARVTKDEKTGRGARPGDRGWGQVGALGTGPSRETAAGSHRASRPSPHAGALAAAARGLLKGRDAGPAQKWDPRGGQAGSGVPARECGHWGVTGGGAGRREPAEGRGSGGAKRSGPRLPRPRVPTRLPASRRAPPQPGIPATAVGQSHSPYLARLLCLLRGRHLSQA